MKTFEQLCPYWNEWLKNEEATKEMIEAMNKQKCCIVGEAHGCTARYANMHSIDTYCNGCLNFSHMFYENFNYDRVNKKRINELIRNFMSHWNSLHEVKE